MHQILQTDPISRNRAACLRALTVSVNIRRAQSKLGTARAYKFALTNSGELALCSAKRNDDYLYLPQAPR
jgi:hypothetical protein